LRPGWLLWSGFFTRESAEAIIDVGNADLLAFSRHFIANPDSA
jgi:N-ethylmaleimide reductase